MQKVKNRRLHTQRVIAAAAVVIATCILSACERRQPLTPALAAAILDVDHLRSEPVYAEVPQRVSWSPSSPRDDYDVKALQTLRNLTQAGYMTLSGSGSPASGSWVASLTPKGFPVLGTAPSARGPCFRALICEKHYDGLQHFARHPTDPTIGSADLMWHYQSPTAMYRLFDTKIDKELGRPYSSYVSFYYRDHGWHFDVAVKKMSAQ